MKPYIDLTTIEKAQLLHQWFPDDINHFLSFAEKIAIDTIKREGKIPDTWHNNKVDPILWYREADVLLDKINTNRERLVKDSAFFSSTIFKGYLDFFPHHCLLEYTLYSPNQKMIDAIEFLFLL